MAGVCGGVGAVGVILLYAEGDDNLRGKVFVGVILLTIVSPGIQIVKNLCLLYTSPSPRD